MFQMPFTPIYISIVTPQKYILIFCINNVCINYLYAFVKVIVNVFENTSVPNKYTVFVKLF